MNIKFIMMLPFLFLVACHDNSEEIADAIVKKEAAIKAEKEAARKVRIEAEIKRNHELNCKSVSEKVRNEIPSCHNVKE